LVYKGEFAKSLEKKLRENEAVKNGKVFVCCDKKAWCSHQVFNFWIKNIWENLLRKTEENILFLDDYSTHKISELKELFVNLHTKLFYIPGAAV